MTECWSEGALRAYLDRELPTEDMQRVAAHLGECKVCDGLCTELAARATHVSALLELLPEWSSAGPQPAITVKERPHWVGIAVALAAGLAVAAYLLADRTPKEAIALPAPVRVHVPAPAPAPAPVATAVADLTPAPVEPPAPRRARRVRRTAPEPEYFVALDDEPFESGVIMRVDV